MARRILTLNDEIADLDRLIGPLVEELASGLLALPCVGVDSEGEFLVTAGDNPARLRSEVRAAGSRPAVLDGRSRVYLHELADGFEAQCVIAEWIDYYNEERPHSALDGRTPAETYRDSMADSTREVA